MSDDKPAKMKQIQFGVPEDFHRKVKMLCALQGITIREYAVEAIKSRIQLDEEGLHG